MFSMRKSEKSVVVSLWSAGSCGRKQLAGILKYVNRGRPWNIRIVMDPKDLSAREIAKAEADGTDGIIAFVTPEAAPALARSTIPTVLMSFPVPALAPRKRNLVRFVNRNEEIGAKGAAYLMSLGTFASYAFVADEQGRGWSRLRERAFRSHLHAAGLRCHAFVPGRDELTSWLQALPKPAAIMAPFDFRAKEVLDACHTAKIAVPRDVALLGVDDDDLICETTRPSLSSIHLDQETIGYRAAETLDRLMSARKPCAVETVYLPTGDVVERESTRAIPPAVRLVERMKAFIDAHALEDISAADVAARIGVSRRLADLRFRELTGGTVRQAIEERRFAEIKRKLVETDLPIGKITRLCGYKNDLRVKYAFKARHGMTLSAWRKANAV